MAKPKNVVRIWNLNFLGGHLIEAVVLIGFGIFFVGAWATGKLENEKSEWAKILLQLLGLAASVMGGFLTFDAFRKFALWVELGDKLRYRMLTHGGTKKWADVKSHKLGWETREYLKRVGVGYNEHQWRMLIIRLKNGSVIKAHVSPKREEQVAQFVASRLRETGLSLQSVE